MGGSTTPKCDDLYHYFLASSFQHRCYSPLIDRFPFLSSFQEYKNFFNRFCYPRSSINSLSKKKS